MMQKMRYLWPLSFALLLFACSTETIILQGPENQEISVKVEVAADEESRKRGLMWREELPEGHGMIFAFPEEQQLGFWMKDTLIPLDILYFNTEGTLVSTASMTPCKGDPCKSYPSNVPAQFALEVPGGFLKHHAITASQRWILKQSGQ